MLDSYYNDLAEAAERGDLQFDEANIQRGSKLGEELILKATGASSAEEALSLFSRNKG